jgi:riboflavin kinase/FMN adenylyltransferase
MQLFQGLSQIISNRPTVLTIGAFDGVHLGHERLIRSTVESAQANGLRSGLVTFFPHPRVVLGCAEPFYLTSNSEKFARMEQLGLDFVVLVTFTTEMAKWSAAEFVATLAGHLNIREMHVGYDFALGSQREGNATCLRSIGIERGYSVHVPERVLLNGLPVSSSRIRAALQAGDIHLANACLGRPFRAGGRVLSTWRDHTRDELVVRLASDTDHAKPYAGTYSCRAQFAGATASHQATVEIGAWSGFDMSRHTLQVYLPGFRGDVYGHSMTLDLIDRERAEVHKNVPWPMIPVPYCPLGAGPRLAPAAAIVDESQIR